MQHLKKRSLGQKATELLRQMVLDGSFKDGERLVEDRIASELGISRTPLREALHRLAQEGILEKRRTGGYVLRTLQRTEIEDAIAIRSMLEAHAAALAAMRCTSAQKEALHKNLQQFTKATENYDIPTLVRLNADFHTLLREAAHSPLLSQLLGELDGVVERLIRPLISSHEIAWSDKDHIKILQSIDQGDALGASTAVQEHIAHAKDSILSYLEKIDNDTYEE